MSLEHPRVSIAIPAFNEAEVLPELLERVGVLLDSLPGGPHELVIVDDGSTDGTPDILRRAATLDHRIVVVALARNFGHQPALTAALDHVTGDVAVIMDADLQDAPEVIPTMLQHYREGYDVVYAQRASRPEGPHPARVLLPVLSDACRPGGGSASRSTRGTSHSFHAAWCFTCVGCRSTIDT